MTFSEMRHRCTFQENAQTADSSGWKQAEDWEDIGTTPTVWCKIEPVSSDEKFQADADIATATHRIFVRNRDDINTGKTRAKATLRSVERFFYVTGQRHIPDEGDQWLEIMVKEEPVE
jgi:SPP1 family predicted phage head-tail adaptor